MKTIVVASTNPVKMNAALDGFIRMFPNEQWEVSGVKVPSGVSEQPMSDEETRQGAINRAENASKEKEGDFWVGIEGGVEDHPEGMRACAWIVIKAKDKKVGTARTATFELPPKIRELILQGIELGTADDIVFGRTNSKQGNGAIGILTEDVITRANYYAEAVICALVSFKQPHLY
jgi:inosine/xanthosine triphosphatase